MKRRLAILVLLLTALLLSSCKKNENATSAGSNASVQNDEEDKGKSSGLSAAQGGQEQGDENINDNLGLRYVDVLLPYQNGLTWALFYDEKYQDTLAGVINKNGDLLYYYPSFFMNQDNIELRPTAFDSNGRGIMRMKERGGSGTHYLCEIDKSGNLQASSLPGEFGVDIYRDFKTIDDEEEYICVRNINETIDSVEISYTFYDLNGKQTGGFSMDYTDRYRDETLPNTVSLPSVEYCGSGVYVVYGELLKDRVEGIYFAKEDKWVDYYSNRSQDEDYLSGRQYHNVIVHNGYVIDDCTNDSSFIVYDDKGNVVRNCSFKSQNAMKNIIGMSGSKIYLYEVSDGDFESEAGFGMDTTCYTYDVAADTFSEFSGEYDERMILNKEIESRSTSNTIAVDDSVFAVLLEGGKSNYLGLYAPDSQELICDPIKMEGVIVDISIVNDYLFVQAGIQNGAVHCFVYDKKGNLVKTIEGPGGDSFSIYYGDGVYICTYNVPLNHRGYMEAYDEKMNLLFTSEDINYSNAKMINP